jgi:hypothetical protein
MPNGPPFQFAPKSGCRVVVVPIEAMRFAEFGSVAEPSTRWFQALSAGKSRNVSVAPGPTAPPVEVVVEVVVAVVGDVEVVDVVLDVDVETDVDVDVEVDVGESVVSVVVVVDVGTTEVVDVGTTGLPSVVPLVIVSLVGDGSVDVVRAVVGPVVASVAVEAVVPVAAVAPGADVALEGTDFVPCVRAGRDPEESATDFGVQPAAPMTAATRIEVAAARRAVRGTITSGDRSRAPPLVERHTGPLTE